MRETIWKSIPTSTEIDDIETLSKAIAHALGFLKDGRSIEGAIDSGTVQGDYEVTPVVNQTVAIDHKPIPSRQHMNYCGLTIYLEPKSKIIYET